MTGLIFVSQDEEINLSKADPDRTEYKQPISSMNTDL